MHLINVIQPGSQYEQELEHQFQLSRPLDLQMYALVQPSLPIPKIIGNFDYLIRYKTKNLVR